jgi:hypothetical protein
MSLLAVVSCSDSSDTGDDASAAGTRSGAGGTGASAGKGGAAGCAACAGTGGGGEEHHCEDYTTESACEAAGCVPTTGTVSRLRPNGEGGAGGVPGVGGAGGAHEPDIIGSACERIEDVFISCEDGFGGATFNIACNDSCTACLGGPWTVGRHEPYTSTDCDAWTCVDGTAQADRP